MTNEEGGKDVIEKKPINTQKKLRIVYVKSKHTPRI